MIRQIGALGRAYRHANRYLEIVNILVRFGFADVISHSAIEEIINVGKGILLRQKSDKEIGHLSRWERIRLALEELGPTFIKLGQLLSNRADLIPAELLEELEKLQDSVPPFSTKVAKETIEEELGESTEILFASFSEEPLAAASISQVHKATLHTGEEVVVKILRPKIEKIIETDLEIMLHLATVIEKHISEFKNFNLVELVEEFERAIHKEINFNNEAHHLERFRRNFARSSQVYVPLWYPDVSSKRVLTLEYIRGVKISDIEGIKARKLDPLVIANNGVTSVLQQIFSYRFFHADPHPGNIIIMDNNVLCFLDYGMMGILRKNTKELLSKLIVGIINRDSDRISRFLIRLSRGGECDSDKLESEVANFLEKHLYKQLKYVDVAELLNDILQLFIKNNLRMPADLYLLLRTLIISEANAYRLDPNFNMVDYLAPFIRQLIREQYHPKKIMQNGWSLIQDMEEIIKNLPQDTTDIIEKIKAGEVSVEIEHKGTDKMVRVVEQVSNRIAFSLVLASIVVGSSLMALSKIPPLWYNIPLIGVIGFLSAAFLGFWLLISILKHGKM